jgi:hypothetical protein
MAVPKSSTTPTGCAATSPNLPPSKSGTSRSRGRRRMRPRASSTRCCAGSSVSALPSRASEASGR